MFSKFKNVTQYQNLKVNTLMSVFDVPAVNTLMSVFGVPTVVNVTVMSVFKVSYFSTIISLCLNKTNVLSIIAAT